MTAPRPIFKATTYLLSRRCFGRQLLLVPTGQMNQIFSYCLAVAAERTGVRVHAYCVMGNHYHLVATDSCGRLPEFMHWLNAFVAKCVNARYGRWESVWAPGSYSAVRLVKRDDVVSKIVYTLNNPVEAGLVPRGEQWPGLRSRPEDMLGKTVTAMRPGRFFRANSHLPEVAALTLAPPPGLDGEEAKAFVDEVTQGVASAELLANKEARQHGRRFWGRKAILAQPHTDTPKTREPRRQLSPRVACHDKWRRIEALGRLRDFLQAYREAWSHFRKGVRDVLFPSGTYALVRFAGARCAASG